MVARISTTFATALLAGAALATDFDTTFEDRNKEAIIRQVRPVLEPIDGAARVYAVVSCHGTQAARFPGVVLQSPSRHKTGGDAIREIFAKEKLATVTIEKNGLARIKIGKSLSPLLQTGIHRLNFTPDQRYNIISAELAIEKTKEVQTAIRRLQLGMPVTVISENMQSPMDDVPHLPASIEDITFDEALDLLATTFASVVFYEECIEPDGSRYFSINQGCVVCGPWRNTQTGAKRAHMLAK